MLSSHEALRALIDEARRHIPPESLASLVMNDPGSPGYVVAYRRILEDPRVLCSATDEGLPFPASFDVAENLLLAHRRADRSAAHRWFSVLAACIELLGGGEARGVDASTSLRTLRRDLHILDPERLDLVERIRPADLDRGHPLC